MEKKSGEWVWRDKKTFVKGTECTTEPGGSVAKNLPASAGDTGVIPDLGRSHMLQNN